MKNTLVLFLLMLFSIAEVNSLQSGATLTDYALYKEKSKYLIHEFKVFESNNLIEKGKIYRFFEKHGLFETMNIKGTEMEILYCAQPTGMINADITNKEVYVYSKENEKVFYLFVMRAMAKALESETKEFEFKGVKITLKKDISDAESDRRYSSYKVSTKPKIVEGKISCLNDLLIVNLDLQIYIRNARSYDFEDIFLLPEHYQFDKINLKYETTTYSYPSKKHFFKKRDVNNLMKNKDYEIIKE